MKNKKKKKNTNLNYEAIIQDLFDKCYTDMDIESMPENARLVVSVIKLISSEKDMTASRALGLLSDAKKIVPLVAILY